MFTHTFSGIFSPPREIWSVQSKNEFINGMHLLTELYFKQYNISTNSYYLIYDPHTPPTAILSTHLWLSAYGTWIMEGL